MAYRQRKLAIMGMGRITMKDKDVLNRLALDCDLYNLSEKEALEYIKQRLGKEISGRTYRRYRHNVQNGNITQEWINQFTKVGFIVQHHELVECVKQLLSETWKDLRKEKNKTVPELTQIRKTIQDYEEQLNQKTIDSSN